jgi:hypothetical protein
MFISVSVAALIQQHKILHFKLNINQGMYLVERERNLFFYSEIL